MKILAIDTSCDDTSVAISEDLRILANVSWSKFKTHNDFGGVIPTEAKRQHKEFLDPVIAEALKVSKLSIEDIDAIAVTYGPGLAIALEAGIEKAKELSKKYNKKLIGVNHMIGHIYSSLAQDESGKSYSGISISDIKFPLLALTISGGHTDLYFMENHMEFKRLGGTIDDAVGEAYDKVGRMIGLGFPAGYKLETLAKDGDLNAYDFPRPMANSGDLNWSFSGLKTAVLYQIKKLQNVYESKPDKKEFRMNDASMNLSEKEISDLAASFQEAALESLLMKLRKAISQYSPKMLVIGGGVIANQALRNKLEKLCDISKTKLVYPIPMWLCTDNASMIAIAANFYAKNNLYIKDIDSLDRIPGLEIS
ncbi:tRNA (adenosine(37)-N6)-threonylcarbamoyltransferase complex transferase subunit TsaD [candidate division WWE3 bacterium CG_4_9_14_0_2_um_filter_35_11]|uniref:tRNA N6-adenosine threonylcarbamoyltransferase n=1 Tax=candidate division WWE3 bacterium CG_4_9_14_0_2_um_filter_35_11 TaxID=1975077 RepID=A0A2M8EKP2_UNCKA|nr:MAG: tRNA (adenosine(37)-N6)-threonylcarbamoyltransferase complex transferase subunit TsaD [candidate division WWE3 bacterium CG10_big_fil_rev_8_21_14_0_10_35_32]PJC23285.1 MAG: tRNA (adenosine(37)-N6)-threonylcarbamoyltransferase complex transferase subunit TsaD [candidate division WWE3 bacterium CG_4_9_14_0_2_um_filter_35_11]